MEASGDFSSNSAGDRPSWQAHLWGDKGNEMVKSLKITKKKIVLCEKMSAILQCEFLLILFDEV